MTFLRMIGFFGRVTPIPGWCWVGMAATLPFAIWMEMTNAGSSSGSVIGLLLLQMMAVSTGFFSHARRGFYDPVLERSSRRSAAMAHFAAAASRGAAIFVAIGLVEVVSARSFAVLALGPAAGVALLMVSTIPWAISARLGPLSGGVLWLLASVSFAISGFGLPLLAAIRVAGQVPVTKTILGALAFPIALPGLPCPASTLGALAATSLAALAATVEWIARADFPLREEEGS